LLRCLANDWKNLNQAIAFFSSPRSTSYCGRLVTLAEVFATIDVQK
jgi:hypothetical protein